ncbi:TIGR03936 family radical SAM-associated protein [Calderihabitans maritimus]|uniref:Radical SAM protein n=1 Tax=Calderihabitans maritimus TaxID=1246530 RepID=A0A1Z5HUW3_9FIRM|nr:TIGR03936 family radical SAM-associated protein [Calderihabitans maritimus]GAW93329.1 radical SAM protein [Calderihabitans maritimus]
MQRLRIEFTKEKLAKFLSHLELLKVFERAMRRGAIPLSFTRGFHPHPRISFGPALAVGITSSREYMDVELKRRIPVSQFKEKLQQQLPQGIVVRKVEEIPLKATALMAVINCAVYQVRGEVDKLLTEKEFEEAIKSLLARNYIPVERETKKGVKRKNIREGIYCLTGSLVNRCFNVHMKVATGSGDNVRPEEVVHALAQELEGKAQLSVLSIHREALYVKEGDNYLSPMEVV